MMSKATKEMIMMNKGIIYIAYIVLLIVLAVWVVTMADDRIVAEGEIIEWNETGMYVWIDSIIETKQVINVDNPVMVESGICFTSVYPDCKMGGKVKIIYKHSMVHDWWHQSGFVRDIHYPIQHLDDNYPAEIIWV